MYDQCKECGTHGAPQPRSWLCAACFDIAMNSARSIADQTNDLDRLHTYEIRRNSSELGEMWALWRIDEDGSHLIQSTSGAMTWENAIHWATVELRLVQARWYQETETSYRTEAWAA